VPVTERDLIYRTKDSTPTPAITLLTQAYLPSRNLQDTKYHPLHYIKRV